MYDHVPLKWITENAWVFFINLLSALVLALGFKCFLAPSFASTETRLASGGMTGIAQDFILLIDLFTDNWGDAHYDLLYGILYFAFNVPLFFLAFFGIGKRFSIYTIINVALVSLITNFFDFPGLNSFIDGIAEFVDANGGMVARAIFAGICTGLSSALAFKVDCSGGGIDVVAYYIAIKKSTLVGKYSTLLNFVTITVYAILSVCHGVSSSTAWGKVLFSIIYLFVVMLVVDMINIRNKKMQLEIVSDNPNLGDFVISNLPHGATITKGVGAFTGKEKFIITVVLSSYEVKNAVKMIQEAEPSAFIKVQELKQVFGKFYLPPIR
jgi:uncharacterized membrane-anchored protein YitT (DUF2179 family)